MDLAFQGMTYIISMNTQHSPPKVSLVISLGKEALVPTTQPPATAPSDLRMGGDRMQATPQKEAEEAMEARTGTGSVW